MAITYKIHSQKIREDQYELFFDLIENGKIISGSQRKAIGKESLAPIAIEALMREKIIPQNTIKPEEPERIYSMTEVNQILIDKGHLTPGQTLDDLPTKVAEFGEVIT